MSRTAIYLIIGASALAWVVLSVWTVRRLWQGWSTQYQRLVYKFGVRYFGIGCWLAMSIVMPLMQQDEVMSPAASAAFSLFIGFPIFLWAGYFWGRSMARFYGLAE
jgi:hypothetical protein